MITVLYAHQFDYPYTNKKRFPMLPLKIAALHHPEQAIDIDAYLDSGAEGSLFDGKIGRALNLDLFSGPPRQYGFTMGATIEGRLHWVQLSHPSLGSFDLEVGFSTVPVRRNLLGRDFFNLIQIGFRERYLAFYVTPTP